MFDDQEIDEIEKLAWEAFQKLPEDTFAITGAGGNTREPLPPSPNIVPGSFSALGAYQVYLEQKNARSNRADRASGKQKKGIAQHRRPEPEDYRDFAFAWVVKFVARFFSEIRNIICKGKSSVGLTVKRNAASGVVTALAAWLMQQFNLSSPMAIATAAMIIQAIANAGLKSFCDMTSEEALSAMRAKFDR